MSENRKSEGNLITLELSTAVSNIAAGRMVAANTGANEIYSLDAESTGFSATAGAIGVRFVGILDESVSALQCPVTVWTEGVFKIQLSSAIATAAFVGMPVYPCVSGGGALLTTSGITGSLPVGTVVGVPAAAGGTSGTYVQVKITPGAYRWGIFGRANAIATADAVMDFGDIWPPVV